MSLLTQDEIIRQLQVLSHWELIDNQIIRTFVFKNFIEAVRFVTHVAEMAEDLDHHPDILIHSWNNVTITLSTHSEGGLTEKDFKLAKLIKDLFEQF
ncbi:4a-hydroxytetrahydrobiopterin dehydratase [candidate division KSB1 bacterium]|nr:4a-hydroxytetrahydrobiopterin dehydratase [candidate division KSB1 bacterium]RQW01542.1 MAG: 4a-hydroxytetrahydrobiopterin dehydratase [candidate division KSB1 bacterium]